MKKVILLFIVFMTMVHFVNAQVGNPLGLAFDGNTTLSYCTVNDRPICKMKVKVMTPPLGGGGSLHISATIDGVFPAIYHVHGTLNAAGQIVEIEFEGTASSSPSRRVSVEMYLGNFGSNNNYSYIEDLQPVIKYSINPQLVVKAKNTVISDAQWFQTQPVTSSSLFELAHDAPFFINLFSSTETRKYTVAVRHDDSGVTNTRQYDLTSLAGNPSSSNENISTIFLSPYFPEDNKRDLYTVFIHALDCQNNIANTKSFNVFYTRQSYTGTQGY